MKVGSIVKANQKGQIVIPQEARDALGITKDTPLNIVIRDGNVAIYPVDTVHAKIDTESSYADLLKKTRGAWKDDSNEKTEKDRDELELREAKERKKQW